MFVMKKRRGVLSNSMPDVSQMFSKFLQLLRQRVALIYGGDFGLDSPRRGICWAPVTWKVIESIRMIIFLTSNLPQ